MTRPLTVLMISGEYPPMQGGVADYTRLLGESLASQGASVHVLTSTRADSGEAGSIAVHPLIRRWSGLGMYRHLVSLLVDLAPDIINIQYQAAAYGMRLAINHTPSLFQRVPYVTTFHDLRVPYVFPKAGWVRWWWVEHLACTSQAVIVTNAEDRQQMVANSIDTNLYEIPIGSNIACQPPAGFERGAWLRSQGLPLDALVLCYFGFLNASKGGEELIRALAALRGGIMDAHLLMIGGSVGASDPTNRAYLTQVQSLISKFGVGDHVTWTGHMSPEDVSAAFLASDLCVLPYRDGVSLRRGSLMAALTHGMPIVSTRPKRAIHGLCHGENIWLVGPEDPLALADGITHVSADPALRRRLSDGAQSLAEQFDWSRIAERTMEVYRGVVDG